MADYNPPVDGADQDAQPEAQPTDQPTFTIEGDLPPAGQGDSQVTELGASPHHARVHAVTYNANPTDTTPHATGSRVYALMVRRPDGQRHQAAVLIHGETEWVLSDTDQHTTVSEGDTLAVHETVQGDAPAHEGGRITVELIATG